MEIIKNILIATVVLFLSAMLLFFLTVKANDRYRGENRQAFAPIGKGNGKTAMIIYQPAISARIVDDIAAAMTEKLRGLGYEVVINYTGEHIDKIDNFPDLVIVGSAVYVGSLSSLVAANIKHIQQVSPGTTLALFSVGMLESHEELEKIKTQLSNSLQYTTKFISADKQTPDKAKVWISEIANLPLDKDQ